MAEKPGRVSLVGAGPGDPGLITARGLERLRAADVVIVDRLVDPRLVAEALPDAEVIDAGKGRGSARLSQEEINALLVDRARAGQTVCRLKGGDPFVFGRGGEEALALSEAGLPWEVVPGVTSAIAAAAYAGIPVTHRGISTSFTVITGSEDPAKPEAQVDLEAVARLGGTVVFLMGWESLPSLVNALVAGGMPRARPAALVQWGATPRQVTVTGTLADIAWKGQDAELGPPVAFVVGDVVGLRGALAWFDNRPLFGKRVLVTRTRTQASRLSALLEEHGASCVEFPAIRVVQVTAGGPLDEALKRLSRYEWVSFASPNGVRAVRERLDALGLDARAFHRVKVAAIGPSTAQALLDYGLRADLVPAEYVSESVLAEFEAMGVADRRVLVLRSDIGRDVLASGLRSLRASVDEVVAYETKAPEESGMQVRAAFGSAGAPGIDITTFTSSSGIDNLLSLLDDEADMINRTAVACIGPITAARARERGLRVDMTAAEQTIPGLVESIVGYFKDGGAVKSAASLESGA